MTETTARRWANAAATTGVIGNGLFAAFYVSFALQDFGDPGGIAAGLGCRHRLRVAFEDLALTI